jgi:hypothetical protein
MLSLGGSGAGAGAGSGMGAGAGAGAGGGAWGGPASTLAAQPTGIHDTINTPSNALFIEASSAAIAA